MAEISSAVMVPETAKSIPLDASNERNGLKRRQSDTSETGSKRQRTGKSPPTESEEKPSAKPSESNAQPDSPSTTANGEPAQKAESPRDTRRKSGVADEKQRSKRLFGALLGNLNQPRDRTTKRRAEIEQRRKAELEKQDNERLEDKQRRLAKLAIQRKKEQVFVDEQNMHTRHKNLLHSANMLQTKAEPRLYYRPWDLLSDDEDTVAQQLSDAREQIDKEVADFAIQKEDRLAAIRRAKDAPADGDDPRRSSSISPTAPGAEADDAMQDDTYKAVHIESADPDTSVVATTTGIAEASAVADNDEAMDESTSKGIDGETRNESANQIETKAATENETSEDAAKKAAEDQAKMEEAEDEGDHIVEGDEDTVIY